MKRFLSFFMAIIMTTCALPVGSFAVENNAPAPDTSENIEIPNYDAGDIVGISTQSAQVMSLQSSDFEYTVSIGKATITKYTGTESNVVIPDSIDGYPVTSIGYNAFSSLKSITSITIPASVTKIGSYAFKNCTGLTSVTIPDSVTEIDSYAFSGCSNLSYVRLSQNWNLVAGHAEGEYGNYYHYSPFYNCPNLAEIEIPEGAKVIPQFAFFYYESQSKIIIPESVTRIEGFAFSRCLNLTIYGYSGSYAQSYAEKNKIRFIPLDFDPDAYQAQKAIIGTLGIDPLYSGDTPCEAAVNSVESSKADNLYNSWTAVTKVVDSLVSDPTIGVKYLTIDKVDMYTAIIMDALQTSYEVNAFTTMKKSYKPVSDFGLCVYDYIDKSMSYDVNVGLHNIVMSGGLSEEDEENMKGFVKYIYTKRYGEDLINDVTNTKDFDKFFSKALSTASTVDDFANSVSSYYIMLSLSDDMQSLITKLYNSCPNSNWALKQALKRCSTIVEGGYKEFKKHMCEEALYTGGTYAAELLVGKLWGSVMKNVKITFPAVGVLIDVYKLTKNITNVVTNIDGTSNAYYNMLAVLDFEYLVESVYNQSLDEFSYKKNKETAKVYLNAANLLMQTQMVDANKAKSFWKAIDKGWFTFIPEMTSGSTVDYWIEDAETFKKLIERKLELFNESWYTILMNEYPEIFVDYVPNYDYNKGLTRKTVIKGVTIQTNVICYDSNYNIVASYCGGAVHAENNVVVAVDGDEVTFAFKDDNEYTVIAVVNSEATFDITDASYTDGKETETKNYYNVLTAEGESIVIDNSVSDGSGNVIAPDYDSTVSEKNYVLSIQNGYMVKENEIVHESNVSAGEKVEISAYVPNGTEFLGWSSNVGTDIFEDPTSSTTTVIIPDSDVSITAIVNTLPDHVHTVIEDEYLSPTCTAYGHTEGTHCGECGEILSGNELIAFTDTHLDANGNGDCDECGALLDGIARMFRRSLSLTGNIAVNFYAKMNEDLAEEELNNVYMKFVLSDGTESAMPYSEAEDREVDGVAYKMFTCKVHSTQMSQTIVATMCMGAREGTSYEYSVKRYFDNVYPSAGNKVKAVIDSMRNYGAASQIYFGKSTENLVASLTDIAAPGDLSAYAREYTLYDGTLGITAKTATLVLFSETSIRIYFNILEGTAMDEYEFSVTDFNGREVAYKINAENKYLEIPNIGATKLDEMYTITAGKNGANALSIRYGAFSYIGSKLNDPNQNLVNVVKALYAYNISAEEYVK